MIIERVLHVRSSGVLDFYDADYFSSYQDIKAQLKGGTVYLYGKALPSTYSPKPIRTTFAPGVEIGRDHGDLAELISRKAVVSVSSVLKGSDPSYDKGELYLHDPNRRGYEILRCFHCFNTKYIQRHEIGDGVVAYRVPVANKVFYISGYTQPTKADCTVPKCIRLDDFIAKVPDPVLSKDEIIDDAIVKPYFVSRPYVPPNQVIVSKGLTDMDPTYADYFFGFYNGKTPSYVAPHNYKWTTSIDVVPGTEDISFKFAKVIIRPKHTLPFINGFACWPSVTEDGNLRAMGGAKYLKDVNVRHRRSVLVDFYPVGGAQFIRLRELTGSLKEFILPSSFDKETQSFILILDGHLILPSAYSVVSDHVLLGPHAYTVEMEADKLIAQGLRLESGNPTFAIPENTGVFESDQSFLVIVNTPNLQVIRHDARFDEKEATLSQGSSSYMSLHRNEFDLNARGLLYDRSLAVVRDYAREERNVTFYAEKDGRELSWGSSNTFVEAEDPVVVLANTVSDNGLSAKAMLFDRARHFAHDDRVVWPRHSILDFVFRG